RGVRRRRARRLAPSPHSLPDRRARVRLTSGSLRRRAARPSRNCAPPARRRQHLPRTAPPRFPASGYARTEKRTWRRKFSRLLVDLHPVPLDHISPALVVAPQRLCELLRRAADWLEILLREVLLAIAGIGDDGPDVLADLV